MCKRESWLAWIQVGLFSLVISAAQAQGFDVSIGLEFPSNGTCFAVDRDFTTVAGEVSVQPLPGSPADQVILEVLVEVLSAQGNPLASALMPGCAGSSSCVPRFLLTDIPVQPGVNSWTVVATATMRDPATGDPLSFADSVSASVGTAAGSVQSLLAGVIASIESELSGVPPPPDPATLQQALAHIKVAHGLLGGACVEPAVSELHLAGSQLAAAGSNAGIVDLATAACCLVSDSVEQLVRRVGDREPASAALPGQLTIVAQETDPLMRLDLFSALAQSACGIFAAAPAFHVVDSSQPAIVELGFWGQELRSSLHLGSGKWRMGSDVAVHNASGRWSVLERMEGRLQVLDPAAPAVPIADVSFGRASLLRAVPGSRLAVLLDGTAQLVRVFDANSGLEIDQFAPQQTPGDLAVDRAGMGIAYTAPLSGSIVFQQLPDGSQPVEETGLGLCGALTFGNSSDTVYAVSSSASVLRVQSGSGVIVTSAAMPGAVDVAFLDAAGRIAVLRTNVASPSLELLDPIDLAPIASVPLEAPGGGALLRGAGRLRVVDGRDVMVLGVHDAMAVVVDCVLETVVERTPVSAVLNPVAVAGGN